MEELEGKVSLSVSHTTRLPRPGEINGVNYHFIGKDEFLKMIEEGKFVEYNLYSDNYYGTSKDELLKWGKEEKVFFSHLDLYTRN